MSARATPAWKSWASSLTAAKRTLTDRTETTNSFGFMTSMLGWSLGQDFLQHASVRVLDLQPEQRRHCGRHVGVVDRSELCARLDARAPCHESRVHHWLIRIVTVRAFHRVGLGRDDDVARRGVAERATFLRPQP